MLGARMDKQVMDRDEDGELSSAEFRGPSHVFAAADTEENGRVTRAEMQAPADQPDVPADMKLPAVSWVKVTDKAAFSPRDTAEDLVYDGKMWISNAYYHGNKLTRDLWNSSDGKTWTLVNDSTVYDGYSELAVYKDKMWAIKGSVWTSTDGKKWEQVLDKTPFGKCGYGEVVVFQDKMWHLGSGPGVWNTNDGVKWTCVNRTPPYGGRSACAVVAFRDKLWVMAGRLSKPNDPPEKGYKNITTLNDVWCSSDGKDWTRVVEHAPWARRMWTISKVYAGRIWLIGGYDNVNSKNLGDVWYTADGKTWHQFVSEPQWKARHESTCYVFKGSLWVVAGNTWPVVNDVWKLTLPQAAEP